jgi:UDP-N-acetyl-D-mannosaminuronic acid dehydrogenase
MPFGELISVSWKINETTPLYLLKLIKQRKHLKRKKVALLGMTFKADNDDVRNSLSFKVKKALEREHAYLAIHDPYVPEYRADLKEALRDAEVLIIAMNHSMYKDLTLKELKSLMRPDAIICDIWNILGTGKVVTELGRHA